jgi:hemerythrin superfamily protein
MATKSKANPAPVIGNDVVEILENDHRRIKALLSELVEGDEAGRAATLDELKALLTIHNTSEENLVYPAIRVVGKHPGQSDTLYHQQDEAKVAVWELDMLSEDGRDFEARAKKLRSAILAHIKKEEEHEFPHLREAAGADALQELTDALRELRDGLHVDVPSA